MRWRRARTATTYNPMRPSRRSSSRSSRPGSASSWFIRACSAGRMPEPRSSTSIAMPFGTCRARSSTEVSGAENLVAFSTNSATRWITSATAAPRSRPPAGGTTLTRVYCSTSVTAARITSCTATGLDHWRRETAPPSTARDSAWRRSRVARWSTANKLLSRSGSATLSSSTSSSPISRWRSDCMRVARLTESSTCASTGRVSARRRGSVRGAGPDISMGMGPV